MPDSKFIEYYSDPNGREFQVFPQHYFSGCDVAIKMNNINVAQLAAFQYAIQEQHKPIYGYASRTFDEMAIGNRIVVGSFKVAIKHAGYIHKILDGIDPETNQVINPPQQPSPPSNDTGGTPATPPPSSGGVNTSAPNCGWPGTYWRNKQPMMHDSNVSLIQQKLKDMGYNPGAVDSWYGPSTESAVKAFQKSAGVQVDGIVGPDTWSALFCGTKPPPTPDTGSGHVCDWPNVYYQLKSPQMNSSAVGRIQSALNGKGFNAGAVDNYFGPITKNAVMAYQKANGLSVDGIVGPQTWHHIFHVGSAPTPSNPPSSYPGKIYKYTNPMMHDDNVKKIQTALKNRGENPGTIDGWFGSQTDKAVRSFQSKNGLQVDGDVGPLTWAKLIG